MMCLLHIGPLAPPRPLTPSPCPLGRQVGFPQRDPAKLAVALHNTYATVWVRAARKSRLARLGKLLGFARATSDGALSATIWDVAVSARWLSFLLFLFLSIYLLLYWQWQGGGHHLGRGCEGVQCIMRE